MAGKAVREARAATIEKQDLVKLDYADGQFDAVLCFRLIHHLPTPHHRDEIIAELCRVAKQLCADLVPQPLVLHLGTTSDQEETGDQILGPEHHPAERDPVIFENHSYTLVKDLARANLVHSLHLAVFRK